MGEKRSLKMSIIRQLVLHLLFLPLFVLAYIYFEERLFVESGGDIYNAINTSSYHVKEGRFILFFSRFLPITALYLTAGLKTILVLYSLGHVFFFYGLFLVLLYGLRDEAGAIAVLLLQTTGTLYIFYEFPLAEVLYGMGVLIVFHSYVRKHRIRLGVSATVMLLLGILVFTAHPFMLVPIMFVVGLVFLERQNRTWIYFLLLLLLGVGALMTGTGNYGVSRATGLLEGSDTYIRVFNPGNIGRFWAFQVRHYPEVVLLLAGGMTWYGIRKEWGKLGLVVAAAFVSYALLFIAFGETSWGQYRGWLEFYHLPLVYIAVVPLTLDCYPSLRGRVKTGFFIGFCLLFLGKLAVINDIGEIYSRRTEMLNRVISHAQAQGGGKFYVNGENIYMLNTNHVWNYYPSESILISAMKGAEQTVVLAPLELFGEQLPDPGPATDQYITTKGIIKGHDELNPDYFYLRLAPHRRLNQEAFNDPEVLKGKVNLRFPEGMRTRYKVYREGQLRGKYLPIQIENNSSQTLYSQVGNGLYISYYWYSLTDRKILSDDEFLTPMEVDIPNQYLQRFEVKMPTSPDDYLLIADFFMADSTTSGLEKTFRGFTYNEQKILWEKGNSPNDVYREFRMEDWLGAGDTLGVQITD